VAVVAVEEATV
jgi:hypothetical protein